MSNQVELDSKTQQASEKESIIPSGGEILAQIGIDSSTVKTMKQGIKRSYYRAVINWLMKYKANPKASNLEKVKGLLEAFYHLCEVEDWEKVSKLFIMPLRNSEISRLSRQLDLWSYYQEEMNLCQRLLGKSTKDIDVHCWNGIGNANFALGNYTLIVEAHQNSLILAKEVGDRRSEMIALSSL
jgi:hypothetical protein